MPTELLSADPSAGTILLSSDPAAASQAKQETSSALPVAAAAAAALPAAGSEAMRFATSPNVPKVAAAAGKAVGAVTSLPAGLSGFGSVAKGAWNGGRAGWFTGKLAQEVAMPMAKVLDAAAPAMGAVSNVLNVGTIAQAEASVDAKGRQFFDAIDLKSLETAIAHGANPLQAAAQISDGDQKRFGALMSAYSQSRQVQPSTVNTQPDQNDPSWRRSDGSMKGNGFLGVIQRPDGKVSSEISIGVNINGKEMEIPTLVPTLSTQERDWLINNDVSDPSKLPRSIIQKATDFARQRLAAGKSPFAQNGEQVK